MEIYLKAILGFLPIFTLIIGLLILKLESYKAGLLALLTAICCAIFIWRLPVLWTFSAGFEGILLALWPICLVIVAAIFTYNICVHTKAMEVIKHLLTSVSDDQRIIILLVAVCFSWFLEGIAGFGTAVAIPASMLVVLGFDPVFAIMACLISNTTPTMFGSIGIPTVTLANITGLDGSNLAFVQVIQASGLTFLIPFLILILFDGFKALKGMIGPILVTIVPIIIAQFLVAKFIGPELDVLVGAVISLCLMFVYGKYHSKNNETLPQYQIKQQEQTSHYEAKHILVALAPFILIFVLLLFTSRLNSVVYNFLAQFSSTYKVYLGETTTRYTVSWINTPGIMIFIAGTIGALIQGCTVKDILIVLKNTLKQLWKTIVTMSSVLACAKIMTYSGMINDIAVAFVALLGVYYPLAAPLLGALGTFVTGSGTSSEVLFGNVQLEAARSLNYDVYWLCAANSLGTSAGKMISPQTIAIGTAACSLVGKDGEILTKIFKYAVFFLILMSLIVYGYLVISGL